MQCRIAACNINIMLNYCNTSADREKWLQKTLAKFEEKGSKTPFSFTVEKPGKMAALEEVDLSDGSSYLSWESDRDGVWSEYTDILDEPSDSPIFLTFVKPWNILGPLFVC